MSTSSFKGRFDKNNFKASRKESQNDGKNIFRNSINNNRGGFGDRQNFSNNNRARGNFNSTNITNSYAIANKQNRSLKNVVVILEKAGLWLGNFGVIDAFSKAFNSTEIMDESMLEVRPDIVHQCLLALFDSDLAFNHRLHVYIHTIRDKTIRISPQLRPPRTFGRFMGLMESLLRNGSVSTPEGQELMRVLPSSVAPLIPFGAKVYGLCNLNNAPVISPTKMALRCIGSPVDQSLQGGVKEVYGFFVIPCTDDVDVKGIDYVTDTLCLSSYPETSHVQCSRLCEGFARGLRQTEPEMFKKHLLNIDNNNNNNEIGK